jgi:hypothetical protein
LVKTLFRLPALLAGAVVVLALTPVAASASSAAGPDAESTRSAETATLNPLMRMTPLTDTTSCATLRTELRQLARDGRKSAGCTAPASPQVADRAMKPLAASLCVAGEVERTRHAACGISAIDYKVIQLPSGDILGTGVIAFGYGEALKSNAWDWTMPAEIELTDATDVVLVGTVATTDLGCVNCTASAPWVRPLEDDVPYTHDFSVTARGGSVTTTEQAPVIDVVNPAATEQAPPVTLDSLGPARCDSIAYKGTKGCVFSDVAAEYSVYLTAHNEDQVARNIENGEVNKPNHFGWYGHGDPLTRATSASVQRKNRRAACGRARYKKPYSCDEYPFAATYQGAYYYPASNSSAKVLGTQNSAEGAYRVNMYRTERLLSGDPYWVFVRP